METQTLAPKTICELKGRKIDPPTGLNSHSFFDFLQGKETEESARRQVRPIGRPLVTSC